MPYGTLDSCDVVTVTVATKAVYDPDGPCHFSDGRSAIDGDARKRIGYWIGASRRSCPSSSGSWDLRRYAARQSFPDRRIFEISGIPFELLIH